MTPWAPGLAALWLAASLLTGCALREAPPPRLRIVNAGPQTIHNLTVLFPEDAVAFGDVPAGAATEYRHVPNGVYAYAAFRYEADGQEVTQPVLDWVGEAPLAGDDFTYTLAFHPDRPELFILQLLDVTQD